MAVRDVGSVRECCDETGVPLTVYNLWEIEDEDLDELPDYISLLIREWRSGERPGSVYSSVFVDGTRIPLNAWPEHLNTVSAAIADTKNADDS